MEATLDSIEVQRRRSCCETFWAPLSPQFGGYAMHIAGGSFWCPTWLLFAFRVAVGLSVIVVLIWASVFGQTTLIIASCMWLPLVAILATCSYLLMNNEKKPVLLSNIAVPFYQTMLSLSGFCFPMFVILASRSKTFVPEVVFNASALGLALFDILALGARVRFKIVIIWLPIVIDLLIFTVSVAILTAIATSNSVSFVFGTSNVAGIIALGVVFALIWSTASAVVSVIVTRATDCCYPYRSMEEDPEALGYWDCGKASAANV